MIHNTPQKRYTFEDLIEVMKALRTPETGCPWDLEQSFDTIAPYTIEEAYEVEDAIKRKDYENLREELGDLLFQPIYHAQMASEENLFSIHDIIHDVTDKMITRHPHVFGDASAQTGADVDAIWDAQKSKEKNKTGKQSILDDVPRAFPALLRAQKLQKKVAKVGFEWPDITGVLDKLNEEINEMNEARQSGNPGHHAEEIGDVLFVLVNYARMHGLNAEEIMRGANDKFERRFRAVEKAVTVDTTKPLHECTLEELEAHWQTVKAAEKSAEAYKKQT